MASLKACMKLSSIWFLHPDLREVMTMILVPTLFLFLFAIPSQIILSTVPVLPKMFSLKSGAWLAVLALVSLTSAQQYAGETVENSCMYPSSVGRLYAQNL